MNGWTREGEQVLCDLSAQEAAVIRGLVGQIKDMLTARDEDAPQDELAEMTGIRTGHTEPPEDRVLARLLPDFFGNDSGDDSQRAAPDSDEWTGEQADSTAAMRSLHEPELLELKTGVAAVVLETCPAEGGRVTLSSDQADSWLSALNDVRLALGTALEVSEDTPDDLDEDDLRRDHMGVYQWLTWVQDSLVQAVVG